MTAPKMEDAPREDARGLYGQRPSKSHDAARREEFARTAAMSARERMIEALALDEEIRRLSGSGGEPSGEGNPPA